ncbi:MAG: hypothetical protein ACD_4C00009G0001 [uncultured bacterium (gcode 4)]|uniref:Glycerophosphoryl diester phosphodiesterase membrane domain-containing protein n=1 Tax=uncultured bacterium (gcode 4) TaxID=1234023 RepID=K2FZ54_9BACT|nr:MAG: hypothetical protein ACD_4C00009G0001 [uncultured bacterium (gcode 4)]
MKSNIIVPSWDLVTKASVIKKFNFIPSFLSTIYLSFVVLYQLAFSYVYILWQKDRFFSWVIEITHQTYFIEVVIIVLLWFLSYVFLKPLSESWILCLIDAYYKKDDLRYKFSYGISRGLINFLPVFEFYNFMSLFKLLSIITVFLFSLRTFWQGYAFSLSMIFLVYLIFSFAMNILFAYSKFFIIFEKKWLFEAVSLSTKMTLDNMWVTSRLYFTLFLVYLRVVLTIIMFLLFPLLISAVFAFISTKVFFIFWISLILMVFVLFLLFISYFNSVLEIFIDALWYNAYMENRKTFELDEKKEDKK